MSRFINHRNCVCLIFFALVIAAVCSLAVPLLAQLQVAGGWVRYEKNPVLVVPSERAVAADPTVIFDPSQNRYRMWFGHIARHPRGGPSARIGYADSPDGLRWENLRFEVVPIGGKMAWDERHVEAPHVILDREERDPNKRYKMWYSGLTGKRTYRIGYATSPDGLAWRKLPPNQSPYQKEGLVLDLQQGEVAVSDPSVLKRDGTYHLWFTMMKAKADGTLERGIGYATSSDGAGWARHPKNPVISGSDWDARWGAEGWPGAPYVLWNGRFYEMWYNAGLYPIQTKADPAKQAIGYATSEDGVSWRKLNLPILAPQASRPSESQAWVPGIAVVYNYSRTFLYYPAVAKDQVSLHLAIKQRGNP